MSKSIFINLAIDQLWDQDQNLRQLFSARIPDSEYLVRLNEDLGLYLSEAGDHVFGFRAIKGFADFLSLRNPSWGQLVEISTNPYDTDRWLKEARVLGADPDQLWIFAAYSKLEQMLKNADASAVNKWASWNRKTLLVELAKDGVLAIPPTVLIPQSELTSGHLPQIKRPMILKHEFGSGGGGNFSLLSNADSTLVFMQRRLAGSSQKRMWLLQERLTPRLEGCVFGETSSEPCDVAQVDYDQHGLSFRHSFNIEAPLRQAVTTDFQRLRKHLQTKGYEGPVGLDFIVSEADQKIYYVDLNLRLTKTHLLRSAMDKLSLPLAETASLRYRWTSAESIRFQPWWDSLRRKLALSDRGESSGGDFVVPFLVAGIENPGRLKEVSLFLRGRQPFLKQVETALSELGQS